MVHIHCTFGMYLLWSLVLAPHVPPCTLLIRTYCTVLCLYCISVVPHYTDILHTYLTCIVRTYCNIFYWHTTYLLYHSVLAWYESIVQFYTLCTYLLYSIILAWYIIIAYNCTWIVRTYCMLLYYSCIYLLYSIVLTILSPENIPWHHIVFLCAGPGSAESRGDGFGRDIGGSFPLHLQCTAGLWSSGNTKLLFIWSRHPDVINAEFKRM